MSIPIYSSMSRPSICLTGPSGLDGPVSGRLGPVSGRALADGDRSFNGPTDRTSVNLAATRSECPGASQFSAANGPLCDMNLALATICIARGSAQTIPLNTNPPIVKFMAAIHAQ